MSKLFDHSEVEYVVSVRILVDNLRNLAEAEGLTITDCNDSVESAGDDLMNIILEELQPEDGLIEVTMKEVNTK